MKVLDQRPEGAQQEPPRKYTWRLPRWADERFRVAVQRLSALSHSDPESYALRDEIRSLPGFPREAREQDLIYREVTTTSH